MARTARRPSATEQRDTYHQLLVDIFHEVDGCDGSPQEQRQTLDTIYTIIEDEIPDVAEFEASTSDEIEDLDDQDSENEDED